MQDKLLKVISIISIFIIITSVFPNKVLASWALDADNFLKASEGESIGIDKDRLNKPVSEIYNVLTSIGMIVSVIVGLILGITFMMASADDKAKVKEALVPYVVGCVVIFGAFGIWKIVINTFNGL